MTWGKIHNNWVITLDLSNYVKVNITILNYINIILSESTSDVDGEAVSTEANHLFEIIDS